MALEKSIARGEVGLFGDGRGQERFDFFDLGGQTAELGLEAAAGLGQAPVVGALEQLSAQMNELVAHRAELGQLAEDGIGRRSRRAGHGATEVGQDGGIEVIGLGQTALGTSEGADLTWVEHGNGVACLLEAIDQWALVAAGGFEAEMGAGGQGAEERAMTGGSVGQMAAVAGPGDIEGGFANINTDMNVGRSCHRLSLVMRARAGRRGRTTWLKQLFEFNGRERTGIQLHTGG